MPSSLQDLLAAVRKACLPGPWSQGTKLARDGAVLGEPSLTDSITVRVRTAAKGIAPTVTLYPKDLEWSCDCGSPVDPCSHVVAAIIALSQAADAGKALESGQATFGRLRYRLRRSPGVQPA